MKNISKKSFLNLEVLLPSKAIQDEIVTQIDLIRGTIDILTTKKEASKSLQKSLINQIF
jgi:restriction endonuclease S subunit